MLEAKGDLDRLILIEAEALAGLKQHKEALKILAPVLEGTGMHVVDSYLLGGSILSSTGETQHAYSLIRLASVRGNEKASKLALQYMTDYAYELQKDTLKKNESSIQENESSEFIKKVSGKN